ncbi:MAG TPA: hypothetical protein VFG01_06410, partial [Acidobacteriota bacterium]|nr:hypothetical protein [Acidobacteriota bacterium]
MRLLGKKELRALMEHKDSHLISMYMPTEKAGREIRKNSIRYKNLLGEVEKQLNKTELSPKEISELLNPAHRLLQDSIFWQYQSDGLAVFITPQNFKFYRLPIKFNEEVIINNRFYIKPLLPLFSGDGRFYILALSQKNIRLLQASRYSYREVELENIPTSMEEALGYDNLEQQLHSHVASRSGKKRGDVMFHGHGGGKDDFKEDIQRYFQRVDKGLYKILAEESAPIILSGVDYLLPLFRKANSYGNVLDEAVTGNPDEWSSEELHKKAWSVVESHFKQEQEKAVKQFQDLFHTEKTSQDIKKVLPAAQQGRVGFLFLDVADQKWGTFSPDKNQVKIEKERKPGLEELIDLSAVKTLSNGGIVYAMKREDMP